MVRTLRQNVSLPGDKLTLREPEKETTTMFIRHFVHASDIVHAGRADVLPGMPTFCNLKVSNQGRVDPALRRGCGIYFILHQHNLIYVGKFLGSIQNAFGGDILAARWKRHMSTISLRGSRIAISAASVAHAQQRGLPADLHAQLAEADSATLARDRGFMVPNKRLLYAALHWGSFSQAPENWLQDFHIGYLQLDANHWTQQTTHQLRNLVTNAENCAIGHLRPALNGQGLFNPDLVRALDVDAIFDSLETLFDRGIDHHQQDAETNDLGVAIETDSYGEQFLESLPSGCPEETVQALYETFGDNPDAQVHHTRTNKGDLRIRATRSRRNRNVFTMYWQSSNEVFHCRIYLDLTNVTGAGIIDAAPSPAQEPLPTTFKFDCSQPGSIANLVRLVLVALDRAG